MPGSAELRKWKTDTFYPKNMYPKSMNKTLKKRLNNIEFAIGTQAEKVTAGMNATMDYLQTKLKRNSTRRRHTKIGLGVLGAVGLVGGAIAIGLLISNASKASQAQ